MKQQTKRSDPGSLYNCGCIVILIILDHLDKDKYFTAIVVTHIQALCIWLRRVRTVMDTDNHQGNVMQSKLRSLKMFPNVECQLLSTKKGNLAIQYPTALFVSQDHSLPHFNQSAFVALT